MCAARRAAVLGEMLPCPPRPGKPDTFPAFRRHLRGILRASRAGPLQGAADAAPRYGSGHAVQAVPAAGGPVTTSAGTPARPDERSRAGRDAARTLVAALAAGLGREEPLGLIDKLDEAKQRLMSVPPASGP